MKRQPLFENVLEVNHQARRQLGSNVYLVYGTNEWILIDIGYEETVDEIVEMIRQLDFPFSQCKTIVATHADADHIQGLATAKNIFKTTATSHLDAVEPLKTADPILTFSEIKAQDIFLPMEPVEIDTVVKEGDIINVGGLELEVWHTPGHTSSQISLRMGDLLFSADNIYRDGCVGAIDAHHGSDIEAFIQSLERIRESDVKWLLPSHGPVFEKNNAMLDKTIARLNGYLHMADFGTCAIDWPLLDEFNQELAEGKFPKA